MSRHPSKATIEDNLAELARLSREELAERWRRRFGHEPPKGCGRSLLELAEAYAIQVAAFGPLKPSLRRQLEGEVHSLGKPPSARRSKQSPRLTPGTRLVREWNGKTHHVDVVESGFVWKGARHQSLSAIARAITGARWSGPRFFGL
jgi:hypothetical protein